MSEAADRGEFLFNMSVHSLILFTILVSFFTLYISKLEKDAFTNELGDNIEKGVGKLLASSGTAGGLLSSLPLQIMKRFYAHPDAAVTVANRCLFRSMFIGIGVLAALVVVVYIYYRDSIPLGSILKENAAIFALVGAVELGFFMFVARKFIPVMPSVITTSAIESLKDNLSSTK